MLLSELRSALVHVLHQHVHRGLRPRVLVVRMRGVARVQQGLALVLAELPGVQLGLSLRRAHPRGVLPHLPRLLVLVLPRRRFILRFILRVVFVVFVVVAAGPRSVVRQRVHQRLDRLGRLGELEVIVRVHVVDHADVEHPHRQPRLVFGVEHPVRRARLRGVEELAVLEPEPGIVRAPRRGLHGVRQHGEERLAVPALERTAPHQRERELRGLLELGGVADVRRDLRQRRRVVHLPRRLGRLGRLRALGIGFDGRFRRGRGRRRRPLRRRKVVEQPHGARPD